MLKGRSVPKARKDRSASSSATHCAHDYVGPTLTNVARERRHEDACQVNASDNQATLQARNFNLMVSGWSWAQHPGMVFGRSWAQRPKSEFVGGAGLSTQTKQQFVCGRSWAQHPKNKNVFGRSWAQHPSHNHSYLVGATVACTLVMNCGTAPRFFEALLSSRAPAMHRQVSSRDTDNSAALDTCRPSRNKCEAPPGVSFVPRTKKVRNVER